MTHYSKIVKAQIDRDIVSIDGFYDGYLFRDNIIVQDSKSIGINYRIDPENGIQYEIKYFNDDEGSLETIPLEKVDELFILTVEDYVSYLQDRLYSDESGVDDDGHLYIATGDKGWMGFHDGQYVVSAYGRMHPDDILNELCYREVTNHSKAHKVYDRATNTWNVIN
jgi:hypothetical protein